MTDIDTSAAGIAQMDDLIKRIDAIQSCQVGPSDEWSLATKDGYNQAATDIAMNMLRIHSVQPEPVAVRVKPLVWRESYGILRAETEFGDYIVTGKLLTLPLPMSPQKVCRRGTTQTHHSVAG